MTPMRNKIPCTAQKLSHLHPDMIQSVVGAQVFKLGHEYYTANCVRLVDSDDAEITSEVNGPFGLYEQSIALKGGNLLTKCSCTSTEQPFCRHCVAVLLGYHSPGTARDAVRTQESSVWEESVTPVTPIAPAASSATSLSAKLREITIFLDWLPQAVKCLQLDQDLPEAPPMDAGDVRGFVQSVQRLMTRWRLSEERRIVLEAELSSRDSHLNRLMKQMEDFAQEADQAQAACEGMQLALTNCKGMQSRLSEIGRERERLEDQLKVVMEELIRKGSALNHFASSFKEVSSTFHEVATPSLQNSDTTHSHAV